MQELINKLIEKAGISEEQANKVLHTVRDFVNEKFPMASGMLDKFLGPDAENAGKPGEQKSGGGFMDLLG